MQGFTLWKHPLFAAPSPRQLRLRDIPYTAAHVLRVGYLQVSYANAQAAICVWQTNFRPTAVTAANYYLNADSFEDFLKGIGECDDLEEARQIRYMSLLRQNFDHWW